MPPCWIVSCDFAHPLFFSDAIQRLQVEVIRLRNTLESYVRNPTPLSSASPAAPAQENYTLHNSAPPRFRFVFICRL